LISILYCQEERLDPDSSGSPGRQRDTTPPDIQFSMALTWQKSTKVVLNCQESRLDPVFSDPDFSY